MEIMVLKLSIVVGWKIGPPAGNRNSGRPISSQSKKSFSSSFFSMYFSFLQINTKLYVAGVGYRSEAVLYAGVICTSMNLDRDYSYPD